MRVVIFGATGSIGTQTIKLIKKSPKFKLVGISYFSNDKLAKKIIKDFKLKYWIKSNIKNSSKQINDLLAKSKPDLVVNAISGIAGYIYSKQTILNNIDLALANKETLVGYGKEITLLAKKNKVNIYPIDSEHAALYSLIKHAKKPIKDLVITASGGRFYNYSYQQLQKVKYTDAIVHPNWKMGEKISVDSSTLINKAFEVIEAYWLFNKKRVKVFIQPQSLIHALIIYKDKSVDAYIAPNIMSLPIKLALNKFKIDDSKYIKHYKCLKDIKIPLIKNINHKYLIGLKFADLMLKNINISLPLKIVKNDEKAINLFKENKIKFLDIYKCLH